jgi:hypothetical protein
MSITWGKYEVHLVEESDEEELETIPEDLEVYSHFPQTPNEMKRITNFFRLGLCLLVACGIFVMVWAWKVLPR